MQGFRNSLQRSQLFASGLIRKGTSGIKDSLPSQEYRVFNGEFSERHVRLENTKIAGNVSLDVLQHQLHAGVGRELYASKRAR